MTGPFRRNIAGVECLVVATPQSLLDKGSWECRQREIKVRGTKWTGGGKNLSRAALFGFLFYERGRDPQRHVWSTTGLLWPAGRGLPQPGTAHHTHAALDTCRCWRIHKRCVAPLLQRHRESATSGPSRLWREAFLRLIHPSLQGIGRAASLHLSLLRMWLDLGQSLMCFFSVYNMANIWHVQQG